ncbi:predicted protein [Nematostella vectensis]|uniref:CUB domain-containing protein n=1 Tax=Nematostella vectensis TaxID=45351 RepID=A7RPL1_NEMVE|nr:predicted protein [Nematostella vectensis]|eukprot:XP_001638654.1 predicted protein [Nematostella vectensis]
MDCQLFSSEVDCGSHLTANTGFFMSPNHPKPYPPDKNCVWTITVQGSAPQIQLKFSSFDLPPPTNKVCLDYVAIYYGMLPKIENQIAKFCGSVIPSDILVKKKSLRVEFYSNGDDKTASGFKASFFANSNSAITTSQTTAGIVAAIFCGIVFLGVGTMRCIMMGMCHRCQTETGVRECVGTDEDPVDFNMDNPPDYVTGMICMFLFDAKYLNWKQ